MIDSNQLIEYVIRPTLNHLDMYSEAAENLVLGTAMHESHLQYLHQIEGPAIGLWQMEPVTHDDIWTNYINPRMNLKSLMRQLAPAKYMGKAIDADEMHGNLFYACAMCRMHYYRRPERLPDKDDINGLANYWKKYYNTFMGKGKPEQFVKAYQSLIA